jgi:hypothetical protein
MKEGVFTCVAMALVIVTAAVGCDLVTVELGIKPAR